MVTFFLGLEAIGSAVASDGDEYVDVAVILLIRFLLYVLPDHLRTLERLGVVFQLLPSLAGFTPNHWGACHDDLEY